MATEEEIKTFAKRYFECMKRPVMTKIDKTNLGINRVLRHLGEADRPLSEAEISRYMNISTARVAVLLRTMSDKGLIIKEDDASDARKTLISLSEGGRKHIEDTDAEFLELMTDIVNTVGMERMEQFLETLKEINAVVAKKMQ